MMKVHIEIKKGKKDTPKQFTIQTDSEKTAKEWAKKYLEIAKLNPEEYKIITTPVVE
jgi:hypothetical protein